MKRMLFPNSLNSFVKITSLSDGADYYDAVTFAERVSREEGFFSEGA